MRIAGGVILIIVGVWSLFGGCGAMALGKVGSMAADGANQFSTELSKNLKNMKHSGQDVKEAQEALAKAKSAGTGAMISGVVILAAGIMCIVAGILFFVNKAKVFGFIAPGVGILGEVLFFALVGFAFGWTGIIKLPLYILGIVGATQIGKTA